MSGYTDEDGTIPSILPWVTVDGKEFPPVPVYARRKWWERLLRRLPRQTGWAAALPSTMGPAGTVTSIEYRPVR